MLQLFKELNIEDRLQWKSHSMIFNQQDEPGTYSQVSRSASSVNGGGDPGQQRHAHLAREISFGLGLVPAMLRGQGYVEECDKYSWTEWLRVRNIPERVNDEVFLAMSKALNLSIPMKLRHGCAHSTQPFLQKRTAPRWRSSMGAAGRFCQPVVEHIESLGGGAPHSPREIKPMPMVRWRRSTSVA